VRSQVEAGTFAFSCLIPIALTVQNAERFAALVNAVRRAVEVEMRAELYARLARGLRARAAIVERAEQLHWEGSTHA
jgi:hypothetical protein